VTDDDLPSDDEHTAKLDLDAESDAPTVTPTAFGRPRQRSTGRNAFMPDHVVAGRYRIVRFIARGGMGEVYEAEDLELGGSVALKTIRPEVAEDEVAVERFRREIQIARKVTHPNVCRVFDVSYDQGGGTNVMFVTMELLAGRTLREAILKDGPFSLQDALPIARQIADGLAAAHRAGVVHRDLKSANVMLVPEEGQPAPRVVVTDFGLARASIFSERTITNTGDILGSPAYMSPEAIEGKPLTASADIYAFGILLYEMITRGHPFEAETPLASVLKRLREPATSPRQFLPDLSLTWEHAILRCLEREPEDRFGDAREVVAALEGGVTGALPSRRRARLRGVAIALGGIAVIAAIAVFVPWTRVKIAPATTTPRAAPARRAVAVIGFRNQSGDRDVAWLSTALTEMLTTEVAAGEQVRTIPGEMVARTRRELGLDEAAFDPRLQNALSTDYVVSGSYASIGEQLRLDVQLHEALGGNVIASFAETGTEEKLFDLVSRAGSRLREKLGVASVSPEAASGILASLPSNPAAVRYYAEGLEAHRGYDSVRARELLEKAIAADPNFPLAHAALAAAWHSLGYDARAKQEAQIALGHAAKLPREARLIIEAQAHAENDRFPQAAEIYQALWRFYPDNLDHAMRAASALISAGRAKEALAIVDGLKKTWNDPRVDLGEADAAEAVSDYARARAAALRTVRKADARGLRSLAARAKLTEGYALLRTSKLAEARAAFDDSKRRYEAAGDRVGAADALGGIGAVLIDQEQFDAALAIYEAHLKIAREIGTRSAEAADLHSIANALHRKGDLAGAKAKLEEALAIRRESGNDRDTAATLDLLGGVSSESGDLSQAMQLYEQALALNEKTGAIHSAANNRNNMAVILYGKGDMAGAERMFQQALAAYRQTEDDVGAADVLNNMASIQRARGDIAAAEKSYLEAEKIYRKMNSRSDIALVAVNMATIRLDRGDLADAKKQAETALTIWRSTGEKSYEAYALMGVADIEARRGDLARAEAIAREALASRRKMGELSTAAESLMFLAELAFDQGRNDEAAKLASEALATFEKEQRSDLIDVTKAILARIAIARGDLGGARTLLPSAGSDDAQFAVTLADARLATASKKPEVAVRQLTELLDRVTKQGLVPQQLETRLALAEANLAAGRTLEARAQLETLEWDANKRGFGWVAKRAARLRA
jgi:tetratricopeptide (TPR) repeat protein/tRNA A-37 threonylcarbamoyl transferase component Bud32